MLLVLWYFIRQRDNRSAAVKALPADYFKGLNYLLNDEQGKALDIFVRLVENNWEIVDTHFALGKIFRKNGEIDKAIKIHQGLIARPSLPERYRSKVLLELGYDYLGAGWFDRAEGLFKEVLVHDKTSTEARHNLILIYQQEKDWHKAIDIAADLFDEDAAHIGPMISQYYCELADLADAKGDVKQVETFALQALRYHTASVRASILLAELAFKRRDYKSAIKHYQQIEQQDAEFIPIVMSRIVECYHLLESPQDLLKYLNELEARQQNLLLMRMHARVIDRYEGREAGIHYLVAVLNRQPSLQVMDELLDYKTRDNNSAELMFLKDMKTAVHNMQHANTEYLCKQCGFESNTLYWQCPSCHGWAVLKPGLMEVV